MGLQGLYASAAFNNLRLTHSMLLQFWSFSEVISHKFFWGGSLTWQSFRVLKLFFSYKPTPRTHTPRTPTPLSKESISSRFSVDFGSLGGGSVVLGDESGGGLWLKNNFTTFVRGFEQGLADRGGLARGNPSHARDSGLFSETFLLCPFWEKGDTFLENFFGPFLGVCLLPTP